MTSGGINDVLWPYLISFGFVDHYNGESYIRTYSGFLLDLDETWYLCTAAHNIDQIEEILERGGHFTNWSINDATEDPTQDKRFGYPFRVMDRPRLRLRDDELGFDYCIIEVESLAVAAMRQVGTKAFSRHNIGLALEADRWFITGVPAETVKKDGKRVHQFHFSLRVNPLPQRPDDWEEGKSLASVFGQLEDPPSEAPPVQDIAGMSGGAVLGMYVQQGDCVVVKLVGIQSGWNGRRRIVVVCPIAPFVEALRKISVYVESKIGFVTTGALRRVLAGERPDMAWVNTLKEIYPPMKHASQGKHTCPKWAFSIFCHKGYVKGAEAGSCPASERSSSALYALKARDLLIADPQLLVNKQELVRRIFGAKAAPEYRRPNQEVDVLLALVARGVISLS